MRKGEKVYLTENYFNAIYWEDLENGFSLIARPNFQSLSVVETEYIETTYVDNKDFISAVHTIKQFEVISDE